MRSTLPGLSTATRKQPIFVVALIVRKFLLIEFTKLKSDGVGSRGALMQFCSNHSSSTTWFSRGRIP